MEEMFPGMDGEERLSPEAAGRAQQRMEQIIDNIETVITGKRERVELVVMCMAAGGHVLIEDIPGTGKTTLVSSLAKTISCDYKRIQFTPDVMPSDVSGFSIYNQKSGEFEFRPGAAMSNIVLADEINRASAKTQSALLEIMEEPQVTGDSHTYPLEPPFMVLATQNPIESLGTYQLPEAQIDRFMIKISMGYPELSDEVSIVMHGRKAKKAISCVVDREAVVDLIEMCERVWVDELVATYIVHIVNATRSHADIRLGSSPRGSIALYNMARAYALLHGRNYVIPDDVKYLAPYVLAHRIMLTHTAKTEKKNPADIIRNIVATVVVPVTRQETEGKK